MKKSIKNKVYALALQIPEGSVATYAQIAELIDSSASAIGRIVKRNPHPELIPTHRIVLSDFYVGKMKDGRMSQEAYERRDRLESELELTEGGMVIEKEEAIYDDFDLVDLKAQFKEFREIYL